MTKGLAGSGVYVAPLATGRQVLRRVADVDLRTTGTPGGPIGAVGQVLVTGGAVTADGSRLALRTYTDLYEWELDGPLAQVLARPAIRTALPPTEQGEAVAYERDGSGAAHERGKGRRCSAPVEPRRPRRRRRARPRRTVDRGPTAAPSRAPDRGSRAAGSRRPRGRPRARRRPRRPPCPSPGRPVACVTP